MSDELTISEVAATTGVHPYTLRYYERIGLLAPVGRSSGGRRVFVESDLEWIEILKALRGTGMSIRKIRELMGLARGGDPTRQKRIAFYRAYQAELQSQIDERVRAIATIEKKIRKHEEARGCQRK